MLDPYKNSLRNTIKHIRKNTSQGFRTHASQLICTKIKSLDYYRKAKHIALYFTINGEVDLHSIWNTAPLQGKFCYFPVLHTDYSLSFLPATPSTTFKKNHFGILEPDISLEHAIAPQDLDLIILPLVGFDSQCRRLGMGSGSYDRTLQHLDNTILLGVAYQFQHMNIINAQPWDVPLHAVITEQSIYEAL